MSTDTTNPRVIEINRIFLNNNPIDYVADEGLIKAVEIAIALGKPLLISGEPGTGKTKLADYVAAQLYLQTKNDAIKFVENPLVFNTKSTSVAADLFYFYDAVSHFRSQQANLTTDQFIELKPMGIAIAQTHGFGCETLQGISNIGNYNEKNILREPASSVVLIDEIDKASREFPNDLLNEMENYEFEIREMNQRIKRSANDCRIIVIMTSNSEKNLPNAFLRRCVFYHIDFPDKEKLLKIARKRLIINNTEYDALIEQAIDEFNLIRSRVVNKKPSTSEFLDWINLLQEFKLLKHTTFSPDAKNMIYEATKSVLVKSYDDQQLMNSKT
ncbi:MAG: MoxR family ATPase [Panacibacter sp.]